MIKTVFPLHSIVHSAEQFHGADKTDNFIMNEWKRLLAEIKNIKLNTNNNIKQYIHQRCYQVTKNIYGNPKSLNSS